ncbi:hypothetical protein EN918_24630, partial [Mesorhizobium sp. M7A.F.Ca.CA.004.05.1.1]
MDSTSSLAPPSVLPDISPSRGEIAPSSLLSPINNIAREEPAAKLPISPPVGEMSGRTEGGARELVLSRN